MLLDSPKPDFSSVARGIRLCRANLIKNHHSSEEPGEPPAVSPPELTRPSDAISGTDPHDLEYAAEGGSTIVFSYNGPRDLSFDRMVLRLRKAPRRSHSDLTTPKVLNLEDVEDPMVTDLTHDWFTR